jgi:hypothetical protein
MRSEGLTPQNLWQKGKPLTYNEKRLAEHKRKTEGLVSEGDS